MNMEHKTLSELYSDLEELHREIVDIEAQLSAIQEWTPESGLSLNDYQQWRLRATRALNGKRREKLDLEGQIKSQEATFRVIYKQETAEDFIVELYRTFTNHLHECKMEPDEDSQKILDLTYHHFIRGE